MGNINAICRTSQIKYKIEDTINLYKNQEFLDKTYMKRRIKLTENNLRRIISESVKKILKEYGEGNRGQYMLGALAARKKQQGIEKGMTDNESGYNDISRYAANKRKGTNAEKMKQNSFYNGFHSGKDSREYGYNYMKNLDKQNESRIRDIVRETLKRTLNEGGHLYSKDEDGNVWTNSKDTYRGVPGSTYIWHGEWSDPEVLWDGVELSANDIEESLWHSYKDECEENGEEPTEDGYESWLEEMGTDYIAGTLDDLAWAAQGNP